MRRVQSGGSAVQPAASGSYQLSQVKVPCKNALKKATLVREGLHMHAAGILRKEAKAALTAQVREKAAGRREQSRVKPGGEARHEEGGTRTRKAPACPSPSAQAAGGWRVPACDGQSCMDEPCHHSSSLIFLNCKILQSY